MKLRCKKDHEDAWSGILGFGASGRKKIEGLTLGQTYTGELVPIVCDRFEGTHIDAEDIKVMIYNDKQEWKYYDIDKFEPI